jgi:hypothetical protein
LQESDTLVGNVERLKDTLEWLSEAPRNYSLKLDEREMKSIMSRIQTGYGLALEVKGFLRELSDVSMRVITATKLRAGIKSKMAESEALEYFLTFAQKIRNIIHDIVPDEDTLEVFEMRVKREILNPAGATLPGDPKAPPVLGKLLKD